MARKERHIITVMKKEVIDNIIQTLTDLSANSNGYWYLEEENIKVFVQRVSRFKFEACFEVIGHVVPHLRDMNFYLELDELSRLFDDYDIEIPLLDELEYNSDKSIWVLT